MARQRPPRFKMREIVTVLANERTVATGHAGLTGSVCGHSPLVGGGWDYSVSLPRRRRMVYGFLVDELESTGRREPKQETTSMRIRVDPDSGSTTILDSAGEPIELPAEDDSVGVPFFTEVAVRDPDDPDRYPIDGVVVAKARRPDGSWRYGVLPDDEQVVRALDREQFWARVPTDPGEYLDRASRPDVDEVEADATLAYTAVWHAPAPAYGYDQVVRVLDRPHTAPVVGRCGRVITEQLGDGLTWSYFLILDDDPTAQYRYLTVAEVDIEATGEYGEGYNPPPDWRR